MGEGRYCGEGWCKDKDTEDKEESGASVIYPRGEGEIDLEVHAAKEEADEEILHELGN